MKEALDLCLACKGCKHDCPVNVDMATYKAEFLSHYDKGRVRPRHAYIFGWIHIWSRLAALAPSAANLVSQTPLLREVAKWVAGAAPQRRLPPFAPQSFQHWFRRHRPANPAGPPVVLWPDTFNNYFHPDTAIAAVEVLENAGFLVKVPQSDMCCGRPLYDYGFLDSAQRYLHRVLDELRPHVRAGVPVVGMEPSCLAVFKDELRKMLPHDDDASRLASNAYHFGEFFTAFGIEPPRMDGQALLWGHCHHRATGGVEPEKELLQRMGLRVWSVQGGCCGLAGSWGFEEGKYGISMDCGEQALLPAVRSADDDTLIVADGFSCKTQIADSGAGRRALHTAQVLKLAREHRSGDEAPPPPAPAITRRVARTAAAALPAAAAAGVIAIVAGKAVRHGLGG